MDSRTKVKITPRSYSHERSQTLLVYDNSIATNTYLYYLSLQSFPVDWDLGLTFFFHLDLIVCLLIQTRDVKITKRFSDKKILGVFRSRCIKPLLLKKISVRSLICIENVKIEVIFFKINLTHQLSPSLHFWSEEGRPFWKPNRGSFFRSANYYIIFFI